MARRSNGRAAGCRDPRAFVRAHAMPVVAVLAALVTCVAVPPDAAYAGYVHVDTLERIAAMLAVVGAMRSEGMILAADTSDGNVSVLFADGMETGAVLR